MDPAWIAIGVSMVSLLLGPLMSYAAARRGTEVALARQDERQNALEKRVGNVEEDIEVQSLGMQKLDVRVSVLEDRSPRRPAGQPLDFAR